MSNWMKFLLISLSLIIPIWILAADDPIVTDNTNVVTTTGTQKTTVYSPPPSAIAPAFGGSNSDLCTISSSGSIQTQILGISMGATYTEDNCLRLKKAQKLYVFGMKVAAVALMCQSRNTYDAMKFAGTPCPIFSSTTGEGLIGQEATAEWKLNPKKIPKSIQSLFRG